MPWPTTRRVWIRGAAAAGVVTACGNGAAPAEVSPTSPPARKDDAVGVVEPTLDLHISLEYLQGERSKDSHQRRVRCTIDDRAVRYYGAYGKCERGQCKHKEVTFEISEAQRSSVVKLLEERDLFASFSDQAKTSGLGSYRDVTLTAQLEGRSGAIAIAGMWSSLNDASAELGTDARARLDRVDEVLRLCRGFAAPHLPDLR